MKLPVFVCAFFVVFKCYVIFHLFVVLVSFYGYLFFLVGCEVCKEIGGYWWDEQCVWS